MKFHRLEAVRGFAAFYVCLGHVVLATPSLGTLDNVFKLGQEAVMVFFVLSGFVICWATCKPDSQREGFSRYFRKRFARIYSVWVLSLLAMFALASLSAGKAVKESPARLLGNALMLQDFAYAKPAVICSAIYGDTPLWSLHYEWWFYMLFPLMLFIRGWKTRTHIVGILCVIGATSYAVMPNPLSRILLYFGIWWIGVHAAISLRMNGRLTIRDVIIPMVYVMVSSVPLAVLCIRSITNGNALSPGVHPMLEARHLLSSIVLVCTAFAWRHFNWIGFNRTIGLFTFVAPISFSLYVLHYNSIVHAQYLNFIGVPAVELVIYSFLTVVYCLFTELFAYPRIRDLLVSKS